MAERIISENALIQTVSYSLPNKHYIPVDMKYIGIDNLTPLSSLLLSFFLSEVIMRELTRNLLACFRSKAEVFAPVEAPRYAKFLFIFARDIIYCYVSQWINYGNSLSQVDCRQHWRLYRFNYYISPLIGYRLYVFMTVTGIAPIYLNILFFFIFYVFLILLFSQTEIYTVKPLITHTSHNP